ILLIDEAQNLTKEVLEQLRLLSNLETTTAKLLQIILVGQPELVGLLESWELRQLGQRITLSCCLKPLTCKETAVYIGHRIHIAAQRPGVTFSRAAIRAVYRYASGIPRLVNIASDRALLLAYSLSRNEIGGREARAAIKELTSWRDTKRYHRPRERGLVFMTALLLAAVFFFIFYHFMRSDLPALSTPGRVEKSRPGQMQTFVIPAQEGKEKTASGPNITKPDSVAQPAEDLAGFLRRQDKLASRQAALKASLKLWGTEAVIRKHLENIENDNDFFRIAAIQNGFSSLPIQNDPELVKKLDLPAIIECYLPGDAVPRYVVINGIDGNRLTLEAGEEKASVAAGISELKSYWAGSGYILWKNFLGLAATPPFRLSADSVITLKIVLREIGFNEIQINASYDHETGEAIKQIQERHGLKTDGIVGPLTQIALYNEIKSSEIPHINKR
ncbi:MAG: peptidoglycan-binding protein, partial [bacterium]